ncbi:hypothetical protein [Nostoc sp.]|uniref:hypothetical protein n=1 Tax=Nostoc sp. TaxID=1180 RepID=UPI002FF6C033
MTSFVTFNGDYEHLVIQTVRLLRSLIAILVVAALAVFCNLQPASIPHIFL